MQVVCLKVRTCHAISCFCLDVKTCGLSVSFQHYLAYEVWYLSDSPIDLLGLNLGVAIIVTNQIGS
jgi:hypothetical protein